MEGSDKGGHVTGRRQLGCGLFQVKGGDEGCLRCKGKAQYISKCHHEATDLQWREAQRKINARGEAKPQGTAINPNARGGFHRVAALAPKMGSKA